MKKQVRLDQPTRHRMRNCLIIRFVATMILVMASIAQPAVLDRLLEPLGVCVTPEVARRIVRLRADPVAQARMEELARKSTAGRLTTKEREEYKTYVSVGTFIAVVQSKARAVLAAKSRE